ncbi:MAG: hypothetical protein AAF738_07520, partial [Bacteroidota bacterium]
MHFVFRCLQCATVAVFLGRAWQHIYWDAPYRTLFWSEEWLGWLVKGLFAYTWTDYITSPLVNTCINTFTQTIGLFFLVLALVATFIRQIPQWMYYLLHIGIFLLIFLAFLYCKEKFFHLGQLLE